MDSYSYSSKHRPLPIFTDAGGVGRKNEAQMKSQTTRNTFKIIILGNNLEIIFFFPVGHWNIRFPRKQGERELEIKYIIKQSFLNCH